MERLKNITKARLFFPLVCLALVLIFNIFTTPNFFSITIKEGVLYGYIIDVINRASELVILAIGMTLVASASAGTDISVGAIMSIAAAACCRILSGGVTSVTEYAAPYIVGILVGLIVGCLCGAFNGVLVARLKIQPMVATLILYTAGRGISLILTGDQINYIRVDSYRILGNNISGIPIPTSIFVTFAVVIIASLVLNKTALGMYVQSVGINDQASRLLGLKSVTICFLAYVICGLCAGIAGLVASSRIYSADPNNIGLSIELDAILAVALGGNSLGGGKFSIAGSVIGAYTIQALTTTLYAVGVPSAQLSIYKAIVVVIIVSLQSPQLKKFVASRRRRTPGNGKVKA